MRKAEQVGIEILVPLIAATARILVFTRSGSASRMKTLILVMSIWFVSILIFIRGVLMGLSGY